VFAPSVKGKKMGWLIVIVIAIALIAMVRFPEFFE
jgi:hypothetical protein